ncbi:calcium/proton exchanger [Lichtheimia ornata]|uniref:Calcium/proton exchanger n=1 Tax=Lichtheimia ornata TaxID=688661 RepID=A0AAD7Y3W4_9FUNG|nr:calcium/proton exchanger [Lichtheimia ornata]KAJ8663323.1 calcium/proton exchanger [Lichtheimia ornata]
MDDRRAASPSQQQQQQQHYGAIEQQQEQQPENSDQRVHISRADSNDDDDKATMGTSNSDPTACTAAASSSAQLRSRKHKGRHHESDNDDDAASIDSREMTLKDRQEQMNKRHPFGLPIWKPALYKKSRSVVRKANSALHSSPSSSPELFLNPGNILWVLIFGWWLALVMLILSVPLILVPPDGGAYSRVMRELAIYLLWPFGRYVEHHGDEVTPHDPTAAAAAAASSEDDEETGLLDRPTTPRKQTPLMFVVSAICWFCVITIPMAKLNYILLRHLRRHPLSLRFKSSPSGQAYMTQTGRPAVILLCTYQAIGWQYYKYTYDGINIIFINLMPLVFFVIFDDYVLKHYLPEDAFITKPPVVFTLALASVIPLSYYIGMGISSVSAQSSMGIGAFLNASFGSIIEIILYAVALMGGKSALVEGALIGSVMAGVLLMPGCSMISGGVKRKQQRFNAKSAEVTSTMLIMAIIGSLTPTLFYQMFGSFELRCSGCPENADDGNIACSRCYFDQMNPTIDPVYQNKVKPLMWFCAAILPSAYVIGIVFSLRTHVDMVWKKHDQNGNAHNVPHQQLSYYQKLMPGHIISHLIHQQQSTPPPQHPGQHHDTLEHRVGSDGNVHVPYVAMTTSHPEHHGIDSQSGRRGENLVVGSAPVPASAFIHAREPEEEAEEEEAAGHDSPNWSKGKSFTILFGCTLLYSIVAEILVDTVDEVMKNLAVDEKFLGLTLFALVPNITEFMNAISFALYGNIVLSMEIGSAYALQVCLLQIPAMVAFSLWYNWGKEELAQYTFSLIFPRWDVICVIFSVFLLTYTYQEGKSNYFKGSILTLSYIVLLAGFYFTPSTDQDSIAINIAPPANNV